MCNPEMAWAHRRDEEMQRDGENAGIVMYTPVGTAAGTGTDDSDRAR